MDDAALVSGREPGADLARDLERPVLGEAADALQRATRDPRRRRTPSTGRCARRPRRCRRRGRRSDATPAAPCALRCGSCVSRAGIAIDVGRQELERDRLSELQIVGAIDLAHAAAPQASDDAIAAAEQRARLEAAVVDRAGRGRASRLDALGRALASRAIAVRRCPEPVRGRPPAASRRPPAGGLAAARFRSADGGSGVGTSGRLAGFLGVIRRRRSGRRCWARSGGVILLTSVCYTSGSVLMTHVEIPNRSLFRQPEVCEIAQVQPYVLRSWEAEFPDLGVAKTEGGAARLSARGRRARAADQAPAVRRRA